MTLEELEDKAYNEGLKAGKLGYDGENSAEEVLEHLMRLFIDDLGNEAEEYWLDHDYDNIYLQIQDNYWLGWDDTED